MIQMNLFCVYIVDGQQNPGVYVVSCVGEGNRRDVFTVNRGFLLFCLYCRWATEPWGVCSKPCGGGKQKRRVHCLQRISQKEDRRVKHRLCKKREKPKHKKECNTHECPPVWYKGSWSKVKLLTLYALMD